MSMSEYSPRRLESARVKADQLKATGAKVVVTSCHNCVDGLADLIRYYKLDMKVTQLVNLVANAAVVEKPLAEPVKVSQAADMKIFAGSKVLVVDDEPDVCAFISTVLGDNGATVLTATDGDEALELARREKPDLVTLDLSMPGTDGGKVFEAMRTDPVLSLVPICIITGKPELRKLIYERSVPPPEGYMDKPIDEDSLLRNLRKILEMTSAEH